MDFKKSMQEIFEKGTEVSKKTYEKAKELGEMGIQQMEIKTLEHKMAKKIGDLGTLVYSHFIKKDTPLEKKTKGVPEILTEIKSIEDKIKEKEKELKK